MKTVYIASPLGFSESGREFMYGTLIPAIKQAGIDQIEDPWALTPAAEVESVQAMTYGPERRDAWQRLNRTIGDRNAAAIKRADALIAVLDGVDVDSGTAAEIGFAYALGHRLMGYRGDFRLAGDNEGAVVNLQVEYFIYESGGTIVTCLDDLKHLIQTIIKKDN